jgi:hypothetical protein
MPEAVDVKAMAAHVDHLTGRGVTLAHTWFRP